MPQKDPFKVSTIVSMKAPPQTEELGEKGRVRKRAGGAMEDVNSIHYYYATLYSSMI